LNLCIKSLANRSGKGCEGDVLGDLELFVFEKEFTGIHSPKMGSGIEFRGRLCFEVYSCSEYNRVRTLNEVVEGNALCNVLRREPIGIVRITLCIKLVCGNPQKRVLERVTYEEYGEQFCG
jgi:hypothetical protein